MRGCSSPFAAGLPGGRGRGAPPPLSTSHSPRHGGGWGWQNHERDDASSVGTGLDEERAEGTPMGDTRDLGANFDWMMPRVEAHARNAPPPSTCVEPDYRELIHSVSWVLSRRIADNEGFDSKKILPLFCEDTHTATPAEDRYGVEFPVFHQSCFATPTLYTLSRLPPLPTPPRLYPVPLASEVFEFVENIWHRARLTPQSLVICLVYVDRMEARSEGVLLHARSWRPIVFASLLLASKVWHDVSYWNSDFSTICPMFTVANINRMERAYLQLLDYNTIISPSQYATYYFSLRAASRQQEQAERSRQGSRADLSQLLDSPYASRRDSRLASLDASRHELEGVLRGPRPPGGGVGRRGGVWRRVGRRLGRCGSWRTFAEEGYCSCSCGRCRGDRRRRRRRLRRRLCRPQRAQACDRQTSRQLPLQVLFGDQRSGLVASAGAVGGARAGGRDPLGAQFQRREPRVLAQERRAPKDAARANSLNTHWSRTGRRLPRLLRPGGAARVRYQSGGFEQIRRRDKQT